MKMFTTRRCLPPEDVYHPKMFTTRRCLPPEDDTRRLWMMLDEDDRSAVDEPMAQWKPTHKSKWNRYRNRMNMGDIIASFGYWHLLSTPQSPMEVYVDDDSKLTLHGLQQHYVKLKDNEKNRKLFELLDVLEFNQVIIFVKSVQRCMALAQLLQEQNFPAIAIHRAMTQEERLSRYQQFKDFQKRILVATNLFGRGMDIERVNIVFNYDMPEDSDTYLHRVARAGRFGTKGLAITLISDENDAKILNDVQERFEVNITELPDEIDISSYIEGR